MRSGLLALGAATLAKSAPEESAIPPPGPGGDGGGPWPHGLQKIMLTEAAETKGAVCMNGSPGGYYYRKGYGDGATKWVFAFQGGGYCATPADCAARSLTKLGGSNNTKPHDWPEQWQDLGISGGTIENNPFSYNWCRPPASFPRSIPGSHLFTPPLRLCRNIVFVAYCDGASMTSNRPDPIIFEGKTIHYRGRRIVDAIMDDNFAKHGTQPPVSVCCLRPSDGALLRGRDDGGDAHRGVRRIGGGHRMLPAL